MTKFEANLSVHPVPSTAAVPDPSLQSDGLGGAATNEGNAPNFKPPTSRANSPFSQCGFELYEAGYSPVPILPLQKRPGAYINGRWTGLNGWTKLCQERASEQEIEEWSSWPDAGIAIALGPASQNLVAIDVDTEEPAILDAIEGIFPISPVVKKGRRGYTTFFRTEGGIKSRKFKISKIPVVEILSDGCQSVIPNSVHPDTQQPYYWLGPALHQVEHNDLPLLTQEHLNRCEAALLPFGLTRPAALQDRKTTPMPCTEATPGAFPANMNALNAHALARPAAWVPDLGGECKENPDGSFRMKALWRPSGSGKAEAERGWSVNVHQRGIRDEAADKNYNAAGLVTEALGIDPADANGWLWDRLFPELIVSKEQRDALASNLIASLRLESGTLS